MFKEFAFRLYFMSIVIGFIGMCIIGFTDWQKEGQYCMLIATPIYAVGYIAHKVSKSG